MHIQNTRAQKENYLIIQIWGMGDCLITGKVLKNISVGKEKIYFMVRGEAQRKTLINLGYENVFSINEDKYKLKTLVNILLESRKKKYKHVFVMDKFKLNIGAILNLFNRKWKVRYLVNHFSRTEKNKIFDDKMTNKFHLQSRILKPILKESIDFPEKFDRKTFSKKKIKVGIHLGSDGKQPLKRLPQAATTHLINNLLSTPHDYFIFAGPSDPEISLPVGAKNFSLKRNLTIEDLISEIQEMDVCICTDSSIAHLASYFDIPTISLVGPTNPEISVPLRNNTVVRTSEVLPCQPCWGRKNYGVCKINQACMHLLNINDIKSELDFFISNT